MEQKQDHQLQVQTEDGIFQATYSHKGLCRLEFPQSEPVPAQSPEVPEAIWQWHATTTQALQAALSGKQPSCLPPFDLSGGTSFQQCVWSLLLELPSGSTATYGQLAERLGSPRAVRAVGGACGANPIPVLVPCHRVLAANRKLGGFSGGLSWKRTLLAREKAEFSA